jgi:hypothetical protein
MALPRLNESSQYELNIPSTGEQLKYRPFLIKEQKLLLIAYEAQDQKQIISAILNCVANCTDNAKDVNKLSTFDVDYIFTKIRSKSVGEVTNVSIKCKSCKHENEIKINLDNIELDGSVKPNNIKITEDISLKMKYPTYHDFITNEKIIVNEGSTTTEILFEMLTSCIDSVMTEAEHIALRDEPKEEIERFINSLTAEQFSAVRAFVDKIPKMILDIEYNCESCNKTHKHTLEGLRDFFS